MYSIRYEKLKRLTSKILLDESLDIWLINLVTLGNLASGVNVFFERMFYFSTDVKL